MNDPLQTPFDSVENAQQYIRLLVETIAEAKSDIASDLDAARNTAKNAKSDRRLQAMQIVQFKLDKLEQHLTSSGRLLNDLRTLRRLLFDERNDERHEPTPTGKDSAA